MRNNTHNSMHNNMHNNTHKKTEGVAQQHAQKKEGVTYRSRQCGWQSSTLQHQKNGNPTSKGDRRARFSRNRAKSDVWYGSYLHQCAAVVVGVVEEFSKEKKQEDFDEYRCQSDPCFF
jgi:hypothetical protein